jgi:hypothetical protein
VCDLRKSLFPFLFEPGHPEANDDGWLRIDRIGLNQHDPYAGMQRGAYWAKHIAWAKRNLGLGLASAKLGSQNHGGATEAYKQGFVTDIVATPDGVHWDFQIDSGGQGYPCWVKEDDPANYPPIAERYVAAFDPDTPPWTPNSRDEE